ncbi:30S ribosomal protein S8e [Candidatus Woesearchaeota archaeon]|nr:30S ribosomal protein S8e [Candidatus Woesearchaeota archaeon]
MAISQFRSKRKISGGRYKDFRKKSLKDLGRDPTLTKIGQTRKTEFRIKAGHHKRVLLNCNIANVYDPKEKKYKKAKIETVIDNPANRNYIRRNILTKGTIIKTEFGNAKITNRPGQEAHVNAILIPS